MTPKERDAILYIMERLQEEAATALAATRGPWEWGHNHGGGVMTDPIMRGDARARVY